MAVHAEGHLQLLAVEALDAEGIRAPTKITSQRLYFAIMGIGWTARVALK